MDSSHDDGLESAGFPHIGPTLTVLADVSMSSCHAMPFTVFVTVRVAANDGKTAAQILVATSATLPIVPFSEFCLCFIFVFPFWAMIFGLVALVK